MGISGEASDKEGYYFERYECITPEGKAHLIKYPEGGYGTRDTPVTLCGRKAIEQMPRRGQEVCELCERVAESMDRELRESDE